MYNETTYKGDTVLTTKQKLAVKIVLRMHIIAGRILDAADAIEGHIVLK